MQWLAIVLIAGLAVQPSARAFANPALVIVGLTVVGAGTRVAQGIQIAEDALKAACSEWQVTSNAAGAKAQASTANAAAPASAAQQVETIKGFMQGACERLPTTTEPVGGMAFFGWFGWTAFSALWAAPATVPPVAAAHIAWVQNNTAMIKQLTGGAP